VIVTAPATGQPRGREAILRSGALHWVGHSGCGRVVGNGRYDGFFTVSAARSQDCSRTVACGVHRPEVGEVLAQTGRLGWVLVGASTRRVEKTGRRTYSCQGSVAATESELIDF